MISKHFIQHVLWAMLLGCLFGLMAHSIQETAYPQLYAIIHGMQHYMFNPIGLMFVRLLMMLIVPVIICSLINGVTQLDNFKQLGNLGLKTMLLYLITTAFAIFLALCLANLFHLGESGMSQQTVQTKAAIVLPTSQGIHSIKGMVEQIIPVNIVKAAAESNVLQIIVFSILFGLAVLKCDTLNQGLKERIKERNDVVMSLVSLVLTITPIGVFCLISENVSQMGWGLITALMGYFATVIVVLAVHFLLVYGLLITLFTPISFRYFLTELSGAIVFAFSVSSSAASIPVVIKTLQERLKINKTIASFVIPLGATINMDGTAIMQGVATVFIAHLYHIPLTMMDYIVVILMATAASIGTAGIPSAGIIMLVVVFKQIGLPVEGISMILGVDRLLDMLRTAVNITGDSTIACMLHYHDEKNKT